MGFNDNDSNAYLPSSYQCEARLVVYVNLAWPWPWRRKGANQKRSIDPVIGGTLKNLFAITLLAGQNNRMSGFTVRHSIRTFVRTCTADPHLLLILT